MKDRKPDMAEMSQSELAMRKFLKQLGVTTHQKLAESLEQAVGNGQLSAGQACSVTAKITIDSLQFSHEISADLIAPGTKE